MDTFIFFDILLQNCRSIVTSLGHNLVLDHPNTNSNPVKIFFEVYVK